MRGRTSLIAISLALTVCHGACRRREPTSDPSSGEQKTMSFSAGNQEMNAAMAEGKRTLSRFLDDLKSPPPGSSRFALKVAFREGQKVEYMWVDEPRPEGELFVGRLINDPRTFEGPRRGDQVKVKRADVVDWSYVRDGRLVGGYTLRVMFRTVPVEEREAFQQRLEYRFD